MMKIHLELQGDLIMFSRGQTHLEVSLEEGSSLNDLLDRFRIEPGDFWKASINGRLVDGNPPLAEGDRVIVFPPIGGGATRRNLTEAEAGQSLAPRGVSLPASRVVRSAPVPSVPPEAAGPPLDGPPGAVASHAPTNIGNRCSNIGTKFLTGPAQGRRIGPAVSSRFRLWSQWCGSPP